ncbi:MAG: SsrA-binding protein SmpB [Alphaproteobacteria bacterium]
MAPKKPASQNKAIAENRRARFDYAIEETFEAGIALLGTEVKALREGRANIAESYASVEGSDVYLINANIPIYAPASQFNHEPKRHRRLLLKRREISTLISETQRKGRTIVPLKLYMNDRGFVKLLIGVGTGKRNIDKRDTQKTRDWQKQKARLMRDRG